MILIQNSFIFWIFFSIQFRDWILVEYNMYMVEFEIICVYIYEGESGLILFYCDECMTGSFDFIAFCVL